MKEEKAEEISGVLHSFSGDIKFLESVLAQNYHVSFTGPVTFKNANYNKLIDHVWSSGPSRYPLQKIKHVDSENSALIYEADKCMFCGCDNGYTKVLPYLFGTILFIDVCEKKKCQNAYEDYKQRYLRLLSQASEDLSR